MFGGFFHLEIIPRRVMNSHWGIPDRGLYSIPSKADGRRVLKKLCKLIMDLLDVD